MESMVLCHCTTLIEHVITMRTSCLDTDFAPQMKWAKLPLIHSVVLTYLTGTLFTAKIYGTLRSAINVFLVCFKLLLTLDLFSHKYILYVIYHFKILTLTLKLLYVNLPFP